MIAGWHYVKVGISSRLFFVFFFKQKTAYEVLTCDWSSDVCSSDLTIPVKTLLCAKFHYSNRVFTGMVWVFSSDHTPLQLQSIANLFGITKLYTVLENLEPKNLEHLEPYPWSEVSGAGIWSLSVHDTTQVMLCYHKFAILVSSCDNTSSQFISHYTVLLLYLYPAALEKLWYNPLDLNNRTAIKIKIEQWYKVSTETSASCLSPINYQSLQTKHTTMSNLKIQINSMVILSQSMVIWITHPCIVKISTE